jgi:predicted dehydrogenase
VKLRAGIIGLGVGEAHIAGYRSHPGCQVVALCDIQKDVCDRMHQKYPDLKIFQDPYELLKSPDIDVVSIASYDDAHAEQVLRALRARKHVFVEKPLCLHEEEAKDIRTALRESLDLRISSNLILRKVPRFLRIKKMIREGLLGDLYYLEGDYDYGRLHKLTEGWRGKIGFYSTICGGGIHLIDLIHWFTQGKVKEVFAYGNQISSKGSSFRYPDFVVAVLKFEEGYLAKITANFGCVFPHFHGFKAFGTKGTVVNGLDAARFYTSRERDAQPEVFGGEDMKPPKGDMIPSFLDSILRGTPPEVSCEEIFQDLSVCFAIEKSLRAGAPVPVHYF